MHAGKIQVISLNMKTKRWYKNCCWFISPFWGQWVNRKSCCTPLIIFREHVCNFVFSTPSTSAPLVKVNSTKWSITSDRFNLVAPASPVHRARYSTNWDRKDWPGSEIQMYYGCPWHYLLLNSKQGSTTICRSFLDNLVQQGSMYLWLY